MAMMLRHYWPQAMANGETAMAMAEIGAPADKVFEALVTDAVECWWGSSDTYRMTDWAADLRPGGHWSAVVRMANGDSLPAAGTFLEIGSPRRIVQTRRYGWDHPALGRHETTIAYLLEPVARGTRLTICHGGFAGFPNAAAGHAEDWTRVLGWLQAHFAAGN